MNPITPQEAVSLSAHLTLDPMLQAMAIYKKSFSLETPISPNDYAWVRGVALATVFNAGRVQGIREERAKRRGQA